MNSIDEFFRHARILTYLIAVLGAAGALALWITDAGETAAAITFGLIVVIVLATVVALNPRQED